MRLLDVRDCGTKWCHDRNLRITLGSFDIGVQLRVDDLHGIASEAGLPEGFSQADYEETSLAMARDFLERYPPPSRAREHAEALRLLGLREEAGLNPAPGKTDPVQTPFALEGRR